MFGINKNGTKHKIGIIMPAFFPASRVTYDNSQSGLSATKAQSAIDELKNNQLWIQTGSCTAKTGTSGQTEGGITLYISPIVHITFDTPFKSTPSIFFTEAGGNGGRIYQYRISGVTKNDFYYWMIANYPNYDNSDAKWVAIGI